MISKTNTKLTTKLADVVAQIVATKPANIHTHYQNGRRRFSKFLERPALVRDLTDDNIEAFRQWMVERGLAPSSVRSSRIALRTIWGILHQAGVRSDRPKGFRRLKNSPLAPSVVKMLDAAGIPPERVKRQDYVSALNRFESFLGRSPSMADLNLETWRGFVAWLAEQSWTVQSKSFTRVRIRHVWRGLYDAGKVGPLPSRLRGNPDDSWASEPLPDKSLAAFFEGYYRPIKLRTRALNTVRLYRFSIRNLCRFLGRHATLADCNDETVSAMLCWMGEAGRSPFTLEKERSQLLAIWRAAHRKNLVTEWPDVMPEKLPHRTPAAWTREELVRLWQSASVARGKVEGIPARLYFPALLWVALYSAERIGAILSLRWSDFEPDGGWITFRAEGRKGGREDNTCRLPKAAIQAVKRIAEPSRELIFPTPRDQGVTALYAMLDRILIAAGLPTDCKSKFHRLRKTAASFYEAKGGNATALLRHANRKTTLSYLDPRIVKPPQAADLLDGLLPDEWN